MSSTISPPPVALVLDAAAPLPLRVAVEMSLGGARVFCGLRGIESRTWVEDTATAGGTMVESVVVDPRRPETTRACLRHVVERAGRIDLVVVPLTFSHDAAALLAEHAGRFGPCRVVRLGSDGAFIPFHTAPLRAAA